MTPDLTENIRRCHELGWSFTPLNGKKPVLPGWQERPRETLEEALEWAAKGNVGLRTGRASGGIYVIDKDPGGDVSGLNLPNTVTGKTGRPEAFHFFFHHDGTLGNSNGKLGSHIDVRGDGGQVVFPGSVHPETGVRYEWVEGHEPWNIEVAELPAHVVELLLAPDKAKGSGGREAGPPPLPKAQPPKEPPADALKRYAARAMKFELAAVCSARDGTRNDTLNKAAFSLGTLVGGGYLDRGEVEAALRGAAESAGLGVQEASATIRSGIEAGVKQPRRIDLKDEPKTCAGGGADPEYILVAGAHKDDQDNYIEQSNATFADEVLSRLPADAIYRKDFIPGEILGEAGKCKWVEFCQDRMRIVTDFFVKLGKWASSKKTGGQVLVFKPCSKDHAGVIIAQAKQARHIRELSLMVGYPVYGPGFKRPTPGWHDGLYYDEPPELKDLQPERDGMAIWDAFLDLLVDFPFKSDADLQNFIGLMLTPIIAPALDGNRPMHLLHSPLERTGKTKLAEEVFGGVILGRQTPAMQVTEHDEERDKRIIALLLQGETMLHLDNLPPYIDSSAVSSLLTATTYSGRLLGSSRIINLPNNLTVVASGNNVQASGEIAKRIVPIMLQPTTPHPEARQDFQHPDLRAYVRDNRRKVFSCLLGMVENWLAKGKPTHRNRLGGFESWSGVVGGILEANGFMHWRENEAAFQQFADPGGVEMERFVEAWHERYGTHECTAKDLMAIAEHDELFAYVFARPSAQAVGAAFGKMLQRQVDAPVGEWFIRHRMARHSLYRLEPILGVQE